MDCLKETLVITPALMPTSYEEDAGEIILAIDASLVDKEVVLMQLGKQGRLNYSSYESSLWSEAEKRYDTGKRECRGLLKMLKCGITLMENDL
jgi:hypothetical protein